jgi:hypothetical protein
MLQDQISGAYSMLKGGKIAMWSCGVMKSMRNAKRGRKLEWVEDWRRKMQEVPGAETN